MISRRIIITLLVFLMNKSQELYEQMTSMTIKVVDEDKPGSKYGEELSAGVWSGMLGEVNTP